MSSLAVDLKKGFISADGSILDVASDILYVVSEVYANLSRHDERAAALFRSAIQAGITEPGAPVFSGVPSPGTAFVVCKNGRSTNEGQ